MPFRCEFTIRSDTAYLSLLRQWVGAATTLAWRGHIRRRAVMECTLALIEAVDNAIFHAHRRRKGRPIRVAISVFDSRITMTVVDRGRGIGRHPAARPGAAVSHGRGLWLIHRLMHRVESRRVNGRHSLRMTYRI